MPVLTVTQPSRRERVGGIKSVIDFVPDDRLAITGDPVVWSAPDCAFPLSETRAGCYDVTVPAEAKAAEGYTILEGTVPFARYVGFQCTPGEGTEFSADARAHYEMGEDRAVETELVAWADANSASAGSGPSVALAISGAEQLADNGYIGAPLILISRFDVAAGVDGGALVYVDGKLETTNGNAVLSTGAVAPGDVYAIGWPSVYVSEIQVHEATRHTTNQTLAIAERVFALGVDCTFAVKATVTTP
jgi:hypothetical protein